MGDKKEKQTFNTKLFECCSNEKLRPVFQCVHFENGYAYAADGQVAIKQTLSFQSIVNPENLDGKSIHKDSFKQIMSFEIAEAGTDGVECWNENGQHVFFEYYEFKDGEQAPDIEKSINSKNGQTSLTFIGIDPDNLTRIKRALFIPETSTIRLQFTGVDKPILVDVPGVDEQQAILMPAIINGTLF